MSVKDAYVASFWQQDQLLCHFFDAALS